MTKEAIVTILLRCFGQGNKLLVCGNGGSAAMSQHFVGELVNKFFKIRKALPAISLCADITTITAIANDFGFENIFSRQIEAIGEKGDILLTMSTSGTSVNILKAIEQAKKLEMEIIQFPTNKELNLLTPQTQEKHLQMLHEISKEVEAHFI